MSLKTMLLLGAAALALTACGDPAADNAETEGAAPAETAENAAPTTTTGAITGRRAMRPPIISCGRPR